MFRWSGFFLQDERSCTTLITLQCSWFLFAKCSLNIPIVYSHVSLLKISHDGVSGLPGPNFRGAQKLYGQRHCHDLLNKIKIEKMFIVKDLIGPKYFPPIFSGILNDTLYTILKWTRQQRDGNFEVNERLNAE